MSESLVTNYSENPGQPTASVVNLMIRRLPLQEQGEKSNEQKYTGVA